MAPSPLLSLDRVAVFGGWIAVGHLTAIAFRSGTEAAVVPVTGVWAVAWLVAPRRSWLALALVGGALGAAAHAGWGAASSWSAVVAVPLGTWLGAVSVLGLRARKTEQRAQSGASRLELAPGLDFGRFAWGVCGVGALAIACVESAAWGAAGDWRVQVPRAWLAHALGALLVAPPLLIAHARARGRRPRRPTARLETGLATGLFAAGTTGVAALTLLAPTDSTASIGRLATGGLCLVALLTWGAIRLAPLSLMLALLVTTALAAIGLGLDRGPFAMPASAPSERLLWLQVHAAVVSGLLCTVALALAELRRSRELREAVESSTDQAHRLELLGRLGAGMAHDFANFLVSIHGYADMLRTELEEKDEAELEHFAAQILRAGDSASAMVRRFLSLGRPTLVHPELVDLERHLAGLRPILETSLGVRRVLEITVAPERGLCVWIEPSKLDQIFLNLALNGRDAMPNGGKLEITVRHRASAESGLVGGSARCVEVVVADEGIGMDEETVAHAFDPFFTTKGEGSGTGLGLALVAAIVAQSGGRIDVTSELGRGARFRILWPEPQPEPAPHPTSDPPQSAPLTQARHPRPEAS